MNDGRAAAAAPDRRDRKRPTGTVVGLSVLAVVIAGTLLVALGAQAMVSRTSCASRLVVVTVGVSDDIAPAIRHIGQYFNAQHREVAGHCAEVQVTSEPSATVAAQVSGQKPAGGQPVDAWIPDSSLWVDVARSSPVGIQLVQPTAVTVARSPLMIVMPRSVAAQTARLRHQRGLAVPAPRVRGRPGGRAGPAGGVPGPGAELGRAGHAH